MYSRGAGSGTYNEVFVELLALALLTALEAEDRNLLRNTKRYGMISLILD